MVSVILTKVLTGEIGVFLARLKRVAFLYAVMAIFALLMLGYLLAALFIFVASYLGGLYTALAFAGGCLVIILFTYILLVLARRPAKRRADDRLQRDIASVAGVAALSNAPQILRSMGGRKGMILVPAAAVGGFALYSVMSMLRRDPDED
ncbi:hypothetical protein NPA31_002000 [Aurantimonas sp. MSK8Z-1]|uniref:hypothetical protein n=1 Tax=Mangrovibrevibacter kandeliae TaxID=2968473 RepID=UPI002119637F|nr:hypothetical protein [Aurantimonas sp. MSK8Z-1]MCW4113734.1 hypothetical protein [Aurantimonas sp. MSK8Z-1]